MKKTVGGVGTYYPFQNYTVTGTTTEKDIYANGQLAATVSNEVGTTTTYWDHSDQLGGSAVVSNPEGLSVQELRYYPFGAIEYDNSTTGFEQSKKFTGTEYDDESGLSYMGARYQNGEQGRFISQDPVFQNMGVDERTSFALADPQLQNSPRTTGLNSMSESGFGNTAGRKNWTSMQAEFLADPQMQNSYSYARVRRQARLCRITDFAGKRQFLLDLIDSMIFDEDVLCIRGFIPAGIPDPGQERTRRARNPHALSSR